MNLKFSLVLDESGNFKEQYSKAKPSMVGGYLIPTQNIGENDAQALFLEVKKSNPKYSNIKTNPFHAMHSKDSEIPAYISYLLQTLCKSGAVLVDFRNQKGNIIVDSDTTYLNIFAEGVLALLKELLKKHPSDNIALNIVYAHRQQDKLREVTAQKIRIPEPEYIQRIKERVALLIAKLPSFEQKRIKPISYQTGNAEKNYLLMLADACCFALRGGKSSFKAPELTIVRALPCLHYSVPEKDAWTRVQDCFLQNHYAEGIFLWYGGLKQELVSYTDDFKRWVRNFFLNSDASERKIVTSVLSQYLHDLVTKRQYDVANRYMEAIDNEFIPFLKELGIDVYEYYFDLHFFRLTTATHAGDTLTEISEKEKCLCALKEIPPSTDKLNTLLRYKLREIEHLKNIFAFEEALTELNKLKKILTSVVELLKLVDELKDYSSDIKSQTLGSVYGSSITTRCFLGANNPSEYEYARGDYTLACKQFTSSSDIQRDALYLAQVEYRDRKYDAAVRALAKSVGLEDNSNLNELMHSILEQKGASKLFAMMHYSNIMALSMLSDVPLGKELAKVFDQSSKDIRIEDGYPNNIIFWRMATCGALTKKSQAKDWYQKAIDASMKFPERYTSRAAGLVMELERIILLGTNSKENITRLKADFSAFMKPETPESMRRYFRPFTEFVNQLDCGAPIPDKQAKLWQIEYIPVL
ncbi:hypothetical protein [Schwartzia succinivorans]|jgi:tetratricopeptide (TPR) repeat protein|uniref:DUF3800 domain-containing protein n=1 Tax=Schwartzia succinivorans DSM 10502 TaxID=1123243 RepID=A0A1M4Z4P4_9FIRM|nr:hypothetical protein [Schwartzia succinivorans]SHF13024.1 hypothetical protein SAMN02745190_01921 [Schwartzia succinivorans DSM 10502]